MLSQKMVEEAVDPVFHNGHVDNKCWTHSRLCKQFSARFDLRYSQRCTAIMNVGDAL